MQLFQIDVNIEHGYSPEYPEQVFNVIRPNLCRHGLDHKLQQITNATARLPELSQFVTVFICDGSKHNFSDRFHSNPGYTRKYRKHVRIDIRSFQGFLGISIIGIINDKHTNTYTIEKNQNGQKCNFLFSCQNWTWVLSQIPRKSVCHITALITNCDKPQIATAGIPDSSQFVTFGICDGSKHNFSDWC